MAVFTGNIRQVGRNFILIFLMCILGGCTKDFSSTTEESVKDKKELDLQEDIGISIFDEMAEEAETNIYYITAYYEPTGETYPQIVLKDSRDIVCGADFLNNLLQRTYYSEYHIFYADDSVLSVCFWRNTENGRIPKILTLNLQCINYRAFYDAGYLWDVQDDNDYSYAPWPGNGIVISFDKLLQEFEQGNYYLDEDAYAFRQSQPQLFEESVQRQFQEIEERGFLEAYYARFFTSDSVGVYRMYLKEGRVGFFVSSAERWDALEAGTVSHGTLPYDFRIEIVYDWKADTPMYQVSYEVYRNEWENGEFSYLQVRGHRDSEEDLNAAILEDLLENLLYLDVEKTNSIMREYGDAEYWRELPQIGPPRVTWQSERYLCIRQEPLLEEEEVLRFAEEWKRYHVYDLETGESLKLGDIIELDLNFVKWLKEEKKVAAWTEYHEDGPLGELGEIWDEHLEAYTEEQLLAVLEDTEFWLKEETLYFRLPFLDEYGEPLYSYGGTGWPNYLVYAECRISKDDLKDFWLDR